ncbi:Ran GTPase-activating protein 1 domain protein [Candida albicans]|uniref:Ran GTPase-activating protein 1 domain protein n=1 Tax=Candida albicans TaxID=5476 RepID=A0A8H6C5Y4_CANAX|nr:Ran GTPase-activating protein 1 domain protein [Candida albicans]
MASVEVELGVTPETTYSISGKQLKFDSESDIAPYIKELTEKENVKKVDFSGNTIGIEASKALSEALLKHKDTIVEINFSDLYTGRLNTEIPQSLEYLLPALLKLPNLKLINLSDNAFGLQTIDPIEAYWPKSFPSSI